MFVLNTATLTNRLEVNAAVATVANIVVTLQLDAVQMEQMFNDSVLAYIDQRNEAALGVYALGVMEGHTQRIIDDLCEGVARFQDSRGGGYSRGPLSVKVGHPSLAHYSSVEAVSSRTVEFAHAWRNTKGDVLFTPWESALKPYLTP